MTTYKLMVTYETGPDEFPINWELDRALEAVQGECTDGGSGSGFGMRDHDWDYDTKAEADKAHAAMWKVLEEYRGRDEIEGYTVRVCDDTDEDTKDEMTRVVVPMANTFVTSDGYRLRKMLREGKWMWANDDMAFESDVDSWPVDIHGRMDGTMSIEVEG